MSNSASTVESLFWSTTLVNVRDVFHPVHTLHLPYLCRPLSKLISSSSVDHHPSADDTQQTTLHIFLPRSHSVALNYLRNPITKVKASDVGQHSVPKPFKNRISHQWPPPTIKQTNQSSRSFSNRSHFSTPCSSPVCNLQQNPYLCRPHNSAMHLAPATFTFLTVDFAPYSAAGLFAE